MTENVQDPIMLDLETLGVSPNSVILSIGACKFDPDTGITHSDFYVVVNTQSCVDVGMAIDPETVKWWQDKDANAREVLALAETSKTTIHQALTLLNEYATRNSCVWGNGSDFDNAMIQEAYRKCGMEPVWAFWNNRCYRTVKNMFPVPMKRIGTHHNALDDAKSQANHLMKILYKVRG